MKVHSIASSQNPLVKKIRALHQRSAREKERQFLIEGTKLVNEAIINNINIRHVVASTTYWKDGMSNLKTNQIDELSVVDDKLFDDLYTTQSTCGVLAVAVMSHSSLQDCWRENMLLVIADSIQDPGNVGTMLRTALAFGADCFVLTKGCVDHYNPKVVRSAMGASFNLPIISEISMEACVDELKSREARLIALDMEADSTIRETDLSGTVALVFGNEGNGLSRLVLEQSDRVARIPMVADQSESLNVSISCAIALYECFNQRRSGKS